MLEFFYVPAVYAAGGGLFSTYEDQAFGVLVVGVGVEVAVYLYVFESCLFHAVFQLARRVDGVMEVEGFGDAFFDVNPFAAYACPVIEDFVSVYQLCAVVEDLGCGWLIDSGEDFLSHDIDEKRSAGFEALEYVLKDFHVVALVVEIAERGEHVDNEVERFAPYEVSHVGANPLDIGTGRLCARSGLLQKELRPVDAGDCKAPVRKCQ